MIGLKEAIESNWSKSCPCGWMLKAGIQKPRIGRTARAENPGEGDLGCWKILTVGQNSERSGEAQASGHGSAGKVFARHT